MFESALEVVLKGGGEREGGIGKVGTDLGQQSFRVCRRAC